MTSDTLYTPFGSDNAPHDHLHDVHRLLAGLVLPTLRDIQEEPSGSVDDDRVHGLIVLLALLTTALFPQVATAITHSEGESGSTAA